MAEEKELELIWVKWLDSESTNNWKTKKEYLDSIKDKQVNTCETVGWVLEDTEDTLSVAQSRCKEHDCYDSVMRIPRCCILKMNNLFGENVNNFYAQDRDMAQNE